MPSTLGNALVPVRKFVDAEPRTNKVLLIDEIAAASNAWAAQKIYSDLDCAKGLSMPTANKGLTGSDYCSPEVYSVYGRYMSQSGQASYL
jgi:hypothetical protein